MTFRSTVYIPFHLADPGGILFFGHVFALAHEAYEQFVQKELGCQWEYWFQHPDWIVPIKKAEANYLFPIQAGRDCTIDVKITAASTSSLTLQSTLFQEILCCEVLTVHVFCDRVLKTKRAIPEEIAPKITLS